MDYSKVYKDIISVLKLDKLAMERVSKDKSATLIGAVLLFGPPIINLILASLAFPSGFGVIFSRFMLWPMLVPALSIAGIILVVSFVARKYYKGMGDDVGFFRVVAYSSAVLWISIIPFLLALLGILDPIGLYNLVWIVGSVWLFVVSYQMLLNYHKVKKDDVIIIIIIGIVGYLLLRNVLGWVLVGNSYRFWY